MKNSVYFQLEDGRDWYWQVADASRDIVAMSVRPHRNFNDLVRHMSEASVQLHMASHAVLDDWVR